MISLGYFHTRTVIISTGSLNIVEAGLRHILGIAFNISDFLNYYSIMATQEQNQIKPKTQLKG